jgi:peptidoglycan hydrolase-like protein with peptidoglycan-binding domain
MIALVGLALVAAGCAGGRSRNELARLQSQVGLLDERVTQLERSSLGGLPGAGGTPFTEVPAEPAPSAEAAKPSKSGGAAGGAAAASLKPTSREIQQALKNAGFYQGAVDGKMGPVTREAVKEFQRVHGLTDDGVVGRQTWAKLKAYADLSGADGEATAAEVLK